MLVSPQRVVALRYIKNPADWQSVFRVTIYTFFLVLVQAQWVSRLPYPALRVDLLLPLMFGIAVEWSPVASLLWAILWGYAIDTFSGKFWGFHVGSYVVAICLVNVAAEKLEFHNPLYQMSFVGACALGQSFALGVFLFFEPSLSFGLASTWLSLLVRSLLMMVLSPLIIYPIWSGGKGAR